MMKLAGVFIALFLAISCVSCSGENEDSSAEFALAVVEDNILTTDYTALVEITRVRTSEAMQNSTAPGDQDLMAIIYTAKILQDFQGQAQEHIEYTHYVERSDGLEGLGSGVIIVSLCKDKQGAFYLPDVGYELPAEQDLIENAQEIKALLEAKQLSLRRNGDYACCPYSPGPCPEP